MSLRSMMVLGLAAMAAAAAFGCSDDGSSGDDEPATGGTTTGGSGSETGGDGAGGTSTGGGEATGGTVSDAEVLFDFAADDAGVSVLDYEGDLSDGIQYVNLGGPDNESGTDVVVGWDSATSGPDGELGVVKFEAPYYGFNQMVDLEWTFDTPMDMTGKLLQVSVYVESDGDDFVTGTGVAGGGTVFVKSVPPVIGDAEEEWIFANGGWNVIEQDDYGTWLSFDMELNVPSYPEDPAAEGYDPMYIRAVGVQIATGGAGDEGAVAPATVYVDQITIEDY